MPDRYFTFATQLGSTPEIIMGGDSSTLTDCAVHRDYTVINIYRGIWDGRAKTKIRIDLREYRGLLGFNPKKLSDFSNWRLKAFAEEIGVPLEELQEVRRKEIELRCGTGNETLTQQRTVPKPSAIEFSAAAG